MPNPIEIRKGFSALLEKTRAFAVAQGKIHPHGRALGERVSGEAKAAVLEALPSLAPGLAGGADPRPPFAADLEEFETQIRQCQRCPLGTTRKNFVFGSGDPKASLVFVGEAPGAEEDSRGLPFVGAAGALLTKIISGMGLKREKVFICNVLKCRPPLNRDPEPKEAAACWPYLEHQLKLIHPKVIVTLGNPATHALLGREEQGISALRGQRYEWQGLAVYPTFHPSALLRNEALKRDVWEDMKAVLRELGHIQGGPKPPA